MISGGCILQIGDHQITNFRRYFSEGNSESNEIFGIWGSAGFLEIASMRASAANLLSVERGQRVLVAGSK
jgi:S-adenosylmethionine hydrolase